MRSLSTTSSSPYSPFFHTQPVNRILYRQNGMMPPGSDTYKQIEQLAIQKYFPSFYYGYNQLRQKSVSQEEELKENDTVLNGLISENEDLKKQIAALQKQLSKNNNNQ